MNKVKILHCADLHLGAQLSSIGTLAKRRSEEVMMTFDKIVSICKSQNIGLLLIAGDLFESSNIEKEIINSVKIALSKIPKTIIVISPGNHDFVSIDSAYEEDDWSENVYIFKSGMKYIELPDKGIRVWGAGFTGTYQEKSLLEEVDVPQDELINICVMHGDLISENQTSRYNPITPTQIRFSNMDYIAFGHIHKKTEILHSGTTAYAYCGCPEGRGFDECDEKGVYIGTVMKGHAELEFLPVCRRMNLEVPVDISGALTNNETAEIILHTLKKKYGDMFSENLYKIIITGSIDSDYIPDCSKIAARLTNEVFYIKVKDETHIKIDLDELSKETSLKGIFVKKMLEKINSCIEKNDEITTEQCRKAMYIGIKAFDSEVTQNEN